MFRVHDAFHADLVHALYPVADNEGYELVLSAVIPERSEKQAVNALLDNRCEALLLIAPQMADEELESLARRVPTVVMSRPTSSPACEVIRTDDLAVVTVAIDHLRSLGHEVITFVDGGVARGSAERAASYRAVMRERGLGNFIAEVSGGTTEADGIRAAGELAASDHLPTAVIAFDDSVAVGVMFGLRHAGIEVPGQVSVVGYDDVKMAALPHVDLTTVGQDVQETAHNAIARAAAHLDHGANATEQVLYRLIWSDGAPPVSPGPNTVR